MSLVNVQSRYLVVLGVAVLGLVGTMMLWTRSSNAPPQITAGQERAMEARALDRLKFPSGWARTRQGCLTGRCYLVAAPSSSVAAMMPALLRLWGVKPPGSLRAAEPVALLKADHWSTDSHDPLVIACKAIHGRATGELAVCQDAGRVGPTLVNVLIGPYQSCHNVTCSDPAKTEVAAWSVAYPTGR
jgi:hypothetical protein